MHFYKYENNTNNYGRCNCHCEEVYPAMPASGRSETEGKQSLSADGKRQYFDQIKMTNSLPFSSPQTIFFAITFLSLFIPVD